MARKPKTIHYIYKTTCNVTNRYYVGMHSTNNLNDGYMGSGRRLRRSIRKYGEDNHTKEVVGFYDNRDLLIEAEIKAITPEMVGDTDCMNLMVGGEGGTGTKQVEGSKRKWRDPEYRAKMTKLASEKFIKFHEDGKIKALDWTGREHSEETKQKMSESSKGVGEGETNSQYGTCWITKEGSNTKIKKEDIDSYLEEGWVKGRK